MLDKENFIDEKLKHSILMFIILHSLKKKPAYPYDLLRKFNSHKNHPIFSTLGKNDVYNVISALANKGLIKETYVDSGKKKYYTVTKKGADMLKTSKLLLMKHLKELQKLLNEG